METSSGSQGKVPSGPTRSRPAKLCHLPEAARKAGTEDGLCCAEKTEGKKKGRPRAEIQELRSIPAAMVIQWKEEFKSRSRVKCPSSGCWLEFPSIYGLKYHYQRCQGVTVAEKLSHSCPYCEAVFASKVRLQKHKMWNHPERVSQESTVEPKTPKGSAKAATKKRPAENTVPTQPVAKVKKTQEASQPSQNGECAALKMDRRLPTSHQGASSEASPKTPGDSESEGSSLPAPYPEEDPERTRHRRKQKSPKKFTGEQPSISGTFGLKGMNKVEEKLKSGRAKRVDSYVFNEDPIRKLQTPVPKKESSPLSSGSPEAQWQSAIMEHGEVTCPTCSLVSRKTVLGLRKHMEICQKLQEALKCQQCQKQFRSKAGLNYHTVAEHSSKPSGSESQAGDDQQERERLRRILKQMGKLKCPVEGCSAHFSSLMGYQYHQRRCGKDLSEADKPIFRCQHCDKSYRSKTGRDYHLRSEHAEAPPRDPPVKTDEPEPRKQHGLARKQEKPVKQEPREEAGEKAVGDFERTPSGRVRRCSAQVAVFHLQEIAEDELTRDWGTKRRIKDDLVPDTKRLNYTRPGLPKFNPKMLETWKNEVKEKGFVCCPNSNCEAVYSSVSGLKAHLANCSKGEGGMGKYRCLLCQKEFGSESGVKYHISKTHSQNWFRTVGHEAPGAKREEPRNGLQRDLKDSTPGKKRGRKPKERPPEAAQDAKAEYLPAKIPSPCPTPSAVAGEGTRNREPTPPVRRRGKPKKVPSTE